MIVERTREELNPYDLSDDLKEKSNRECVIYTCKCCYPEKKLQYHFSSDRRLVPFQREFSSQHDESCSKNVEYQKRVSYANPLYKDEEGKLVAKLYEKLFNRPNRNKEERGTEHKKKRDVKHTEQQRMRLSALIKKLNLEVSYKQACRYELHEGDTDERKIQFKLESDFSREVYGHAKDVRIANTNRTMAGCTLNRDGVQFFYNRISKITIKKYVKGAITDDKYTSLSHANLANMKQQHQEKFYCSLEYNNRYIDITYDALRVALHQFENTYNGKILDLQQDNIVGAGYQYEKTRKNKDTQDSVRKYGEIDRLTLLLVNKYGIFCESSYEVICFNKIMDYIMANELYREVKFYKPYSFTKNAYGDAEWLEDGVIMVKGCKKVGIVEVFGMKGNEEYKEKTRLKKQYAKQNEDKFVFLTWYPQEESEKELDAKLIECIEEIRKSAYANCVCKLVSAD